MSFHIVREKRGDAILGFRVMQHKYCRNTDSGIMVRKGPRFYKLEDARQYRVFIESQQETYITTEVVE